jgi:hypothetical protein
MNYAMHPVNFFQSGVLSADFPGEAARYIEELFDSRFQPGCFRRSGPQDVPVAFHAVRGAPLPV